ncbi:ProQ/FINO family protein [Thiohalorhabdus sp.]|uniref:ProQ/FINO family protein n=1 Tax=Thiohalorhabdus sp. TaxID=3094134 RepID=UPI002FC28A29
MGEFEPLMRGIERELTQSLSGEPGWRVVAALRRHVSDPVYLRAVGQGELRYSLFGDPVGEVTEAERQYALARLHAYEGKPTQSRDPGSFFEGIRTVLLEQVALRFGDEAREKTEQAMRASLPPEAVDRLSHGVLKCKDKESWFALLERAESQDELLLDQNLTP